MMQGFLSGESSLLDRRSWLEARGFKYDPFSMASWHGDLDPVLQTAFVDFDDIDFEKIKGSLREGGYLFIFAPAGGGKTSLSARLKSELGPKASPEGRKILVIEYIAHLYGKTGSDVRFHAIRLDGLIHRALAKYGSGERKEICSPEMEVYQYGFADHQRAALLSPREILADAVALCKLSGFSGVCIIVDVESPLSGIESDRSGFRHILSLATAHNLFSIEGLTFKFLLPSEYKSIYGGILTQGKYPLYEVKWDEGKLRKALEQRLIESAEPSVYDLRMDRAPVGVSLFSQLCVPELSKTIGEELIRFGLDSGCPRAMWQLGYYLLEEHFNLSSTKRRRYEELIQHQALMEAYSRLVQELPSCAPARMHKNWDNACREIKALVATGKDEDLIEALETIRPYDERLAVLVLHKLNLAKQLFDLGLMDTDHYQISRTRIVRLVLSRM